MNEFIKAYIAGFWDGEGTITASNCHDHYYPRVQAFNTDLRPLQFINQFYKKSSIIRVLKMETENSKRMYTLTIYQKEIVRFLTDIKPYLICKKEQAKLIIKLRALINPHYGSNHKECHDKERKKIVKRIRQLNCRGKPRPTELMLKEPQLSP